MLESDGHLQGWIYFRIWLLGSIPFRVQLALSFCSMITMNWAVFLCQPPHHLCHITVTEAVWGGGGRTIIDENLWNGKYSPSLRGLSQYFFFLYSNRITGAFRHRKGSSEPNWRKSVWEGGPSQVEKSKEPALVALQLGVAVPALLDLDWSHCRAGGVQTCQPHSRDHR